MQQLASGDIDRVRLFLEETAVTCDLSTFGSLVLPAVRRLIPSVVTCYAQVDPVRGRLVAQEVYPEVDTYSDVGSFERYMFEHPAFQYWARTGVTPALRRSDFLSRSEWHECGLYQEVYKRWGCEDSMPAGLPAPAGLLACICSERDTEFSDREQQLMELVRPHIVQLYKNAEMFTLLSQATRSDGARSIVLDKAGRPLLASREAWDLIAAYFPREPRPGAVFAPPLSAWLQAQLSRFSRNHELPPPPAPLAVKQENGDVLTMRLLFGGKTGAQALLVLEERRVEPPPAVSKRLGLSPREAEILTHVRAGLSSGEIAEVLCLSRRTVEKHLENIYCKLGVENRTAAVTVAFSPDHSQ
jgi:DNA-binding CsgD family transcriptional regulator